MIDHFNLPVLDLGRSRQFYESTLAVLGYQGFSAEEDAVGFGLDSWAFGIVETSPPIPRLHVAFRAASCREVDAFFRTALDEGGTANGTPGQRPQYGKAYYAAFVLDPDGHNVEAVCRIEGA